MDDEFHRKKWQVLERATAEGTGGGYGDVFTTNGFADTVTEPKDTSWWGGGKDAAPEETAEPVDRVGGGSYLDSL